MGWMLLSLPGVLVKNKLSGEKPLISSEDSKVGVYVIPTNEELVIAIDAAKIAITSKQTPWA